MGANIVGVSVILREKLQFMYNFNILLLSCLFFAQLKLWKQFTGRNVKSLKIAYAVRILWTASKISSLLSIFVLNKYIMFLVFHAYILKLLFKVIPVVPWLWSLYALYCLVNVENIKQFQQTIKILGFSASNMTYISRCLPATLKSYCYSVKKWFLNRL